MIELLAMLKVPSRALRVGRALPPVIAGCAAIALAGCGLGAGSAPKSLDVLVTRDFGAKTMLSLAHPKAVGADTVMSLLERNASVSTQYNGGFVHSIEGQAAGHSVDWFYYVNGIEGDKGAAATDVHPGDHVWWDLHDWTQAEGVPAVVGSFPEPFLNGYEGKRLPVRVECAQAEGSACRTVVDRLQSAGVPAAVSAIGAGASSETLRVLVGPWSALRAEPAAEQLLKGPRTSGVYAVVAKDGQSIALLDEDGATVQTLQGEGGLIAAVREGKSAPVWIVTATDTAGVSLAAENFKQSVLAGRFAVAVTDAGAVALPEPSR